MKLPKTTLFLIGSMIILIVMFSFSAVISQQSKPKPAHSPLEEIKRGKALVALGGCNDCHSPKKFTPAGPVPDSALLLSGHPASEKLPAFPADVLGPDKWGAMTTNDMTAWYGPWGVSFAANLTPDNVTGIGAWTEETFIKALRTGKHLGAGRPILPPMPWQGIGTSSDKDLKAIFAYLKSIKPIQNEVPMPIPPPGNRK
jgi:hypothetical protein